MGQLEVNAESEIFHLRSAVNELWSLIHDLCRENDRLKYAPKLSSEEEPKMGFVLKGVTKRKEVIHPEAEEQTVRHLANTHPYNIRWDKTHAAEYLRLYGQAEFDALVASVASGKYDMVESYNAKWVMGGAFVPADPVPPPTLPTLKPGEALEQTPWGTTVIKKDTGEIVAHPAMAGMDAQQLEALMDRVFMSCLERAGLVKG